MAPHEALTLLCTALRFIVSDIISVQTPSSVAFDVRATDTHFVEL
jgi:hypothetical protein